MHNCLGKLNLIYCLIYLDNLIVFLQTVEEHFNQLWIVFDQLRDYNLKLKLSKCSLFKEEINYLAHQVSKQGVWPSNANLRLSLNACHCRPTRRFKISLALWAILGDS